MQRVLFQEIADRIQAFEFPKVDAVVAIATGGLVPATLIAEKLGCDLLTLHINFRDETNTPRYATPEIYADVPEGLRGKELLIVDDVSVSGATLKKAEETLPGSKTTTVVLLGKADHVIFPEFKECVIWPWRAINPQSIAKE